MKRRGIRTPYDIRMRCTVDRATDCWRWNGATDANGRPSFWFGPLQQRVSLGVAACWWATQKRAEKGQCWHVVCGTPNCANPKHRMAGDRSSQMIAAAIERSSLVRARMVVGRAKHRKISDAAVAELRASGLKPKEVAAKYGISLSYAYQLLKGVKRQRPIVYESSIFALGAAANAQQQREAA